MRHRQDGGPCCSLSTDRPNNRRGFRGVDRCKCFVKKEYPTRLMLRQSPRHRHALLLTTRERVVRSVSKCRETNPLKRALHPIRNTRTRTATRSGTTKTDTSQRDATKRSNITRTERRAHIRALRHQCHASRPLRRTHRVYWIAIKQNRSRVRRQ
jgi:hypothetical protein